MTPRAQGCWFPPTIYHTSFCKVQLLHDKQLDVPMPYNAHSQHARIPDWSSSMLETLPGRTTRHSSCVEFVHRNTFVDQTLKYVLSCRRVVVCTESHLCHDCDSDGSIPRNASAPSRLTHPFHGTTGAQYLPMSMFQTWMGIPPRICGVWSRCPPRRRFQWW